MGSVAPDMAATHLPIKPSAQVYEAWDGDLNSVGVQNSLKGILVTL